MTRVVGPKTADELAKLGLHTVGDLLRHYPRRYAARGELTDLASLRVGDQVTVLAEVIRTEQRRPSESRPGGIFTADRHRRVGRRLTLTFFNQVGCRAARRDRRGSARSLRREGRRVPRQAPAHPPDLRAVRPRRRGRAPSTTRRRLRRHRLIPVYPATKDLPTWAHRQGRRHRRSTPSAESPTRCPPTSARTQLTRRARRGVPARSTDRRRTTTGSARRARFVFEEALRPAGRAGPAPAAARGARPRRHGSPGAGGLLRGLRRAAAVRADRRAARGRRRARPRDLARDHPMHRLLQGEVGSGKTVVALRAMLTVVDAGGQAALLAPTEVLAQQHHRSLHRAARPARRARAARRRRRRHPGRAAHRLAADGRTARRRCSRSVSGDAGIVVGTHALLEDTVQFLDLGLVVVDEQHRFGVEQRAALRRPRRGHAAARAGHDGDADPAHRRDDGVRRPGGVDAHRAARAAGRRSPPTSCPAGKSRTSSSAPGQRVREEVAAGHQAYVVCPRIGGRRDRARPTAQRRTPDDDDGGEPRSRPAARRPRRRARAGRRTAGRPAAWRCCTAGCPPRPRTT